MSIYKSQIYDLVSMIKENDFMDNKIEHINPHTLIKNPAFSQIVVTPSGGKTIYISGQNAVNVNGEIIGKGNIQAQTQQVMKNIENALESCGASWENIVKMNIFIVEGQNAFSAFQTSQEFLQSIEPPTITVVSVSNLSNPDYLIEIDAVAFIFEKIE